MTPEDAVREPNEADAWAPRSMADRLRRRVGTAVLDGFFVGTARLARLHPAARPEAHGIRLERDVPYTAAGAAPHRLDVYHPPARYEGLRPVVFYVHGGGFRILSKDALWVMALAYARRGYLVFSVDYRLAPAHPFPAAIEDVCDAYRWVVANAERFGGDTRRLFVAGESAGANLVTALTVATCTRRPEPWAGAVFETGVVPRATLPACGLHQVTDPARFRRKWGKLPRFVDAHLLDVTDAYLSRRPAGVSLDLADPLCLFERGEAMDRPLPPFFIGCGTADPLIDDSRRLAAAVTALGGIAEARYYPGEPHAFHAFVVRKPARRFWLDTYDFMKRHDEPDA